MRKVKRVAVFGGATIPADEYQSLEDVGRLLAGEGIEVITGAYSGSMEAPAKGATSAGGRAQGFGLGRHFAKLQPNPHLTDCFDCASVHPDSIERAFTLRLGYMIERADAFILASSWGVGTALEFVVLCLANAKIWKGEPKRVAIVCVAGNRAAADVVFEAKLWGWIPKGCPWLAIVTTPQQAVEWVTGQTSRE